MTLKLYPVILAGGSGTRLWPLSRKNFPKQFLRLNDESSLLQQTLKRAMSLPHEQILMVSREAHYFLCQEQLQSFHANLHYLLEPSARNTAPAIAAAAHYLHLQGVPDALMLILPSDHWIGDERAWHDAMIQSAHYMADKAELMTFGIQPTAPKTGYGYINAQVTNAVCPYPVQRFCEKPDVKTAETFLKGHYYWNSGMFMCTATAYLDALEQHAPAIFKATEAAVANCRHLHDFTRLDSEAFSECPGDSIDYAVMEKTNKAVMMPLTLPWSDLGCWTAVAEANPPNEEGNTFQGRVIAKDTKDCLVVSQEALVTTLGLRDQIVVATADAVLIADKRYSQQVKDLVEALQAEDAKLTDEHLRVSRPWGHYEILAEGPSFKVKRLMVKPGAQLSLQSHEHRSEHWVVVSGTADVINGERRFTLSVNQSTYIPKHTQHRLSNKSDSPLYIIEVQSGDYLGEDDITRYDDAYHRETTTETA